MQRASRRSVGIAIVAGLVMCAGAAIVLISNPPSITIDAAAVQVARASLTPETGGSQQPGGACLARFERGSGWADLCWAATQVSAEEDPATDYYQLRVYGSYEGLRALAIQSRLIGTPGDNVYDVWPDGTYSGGCRQEPVSLAVPMGALPADDLCGRTVGRLDSTRWWYDVAWSCEGCIVPDSMTRGISAYAVIGVAAGQVPSWDLFVDARS